MKHRVEFFQDGQTWSIEVEDGETLLQAAHACEAPVLTLCHGIGACVQCKVRIEAGLEHLSKPENLERDRIGNIFHLTGERMACQAHVHGPCRVEALPLRVPKKKSVLPGPRRA